MSRAARLGLTAVVLVAAAAFYLVQLPRVGRLPNNDYYWVLHQITGERGVTASPARWLSLKSNEHTVILPAMVYVANIWLTGGDNRVLAAFALVLLAVVFLVLSDLLLREFEGSLAARAVAGSALGAVLFAPTTAHNVVMGFSGTMWFMANAFAVAAVAALVRRSEGGRLWPVALLASAAALSYSTGLFAWPALWLGAIWLRTRRRDLVALGVGGAVLLAFSLASFEPVSGHPPPNFGDWPRLLGYLGGYLGGLFTFDAALAIVVGWSGLAIAVAAAFHSWRCAARRRFAPWIAIAAYAALNGAAAAVFRSGLPEGPGLSRYASLPSLFWVSLLAIGFVALDLRGAWRPGKSAVSVALAAGLVAGVVVILYRRGLPTLRELLARAAYQPVAAQALRLGIHDDEMVGHVTYFPEEIWGVHDFLKNARHVPFRQADEPHGGQASRFEDSRPEVRGRSENLAVIDESYVRIDGWAFDGGDPIDDVEIVDSSGAVRGRAIVGLPRPDVAGREGRATSDSGWSAYVARGGGRQLRAYAHPAHAGAAYRLDGELEIPDPTATPAPSP